MSARCNVAMWWWWAFSGNVTTVGEGRSYLEHSMCSRRHWGRGYRVKYNPDSFPTLFYLHLLCLFLVKAHIMHDFASLHKSFCPCVLTVTLFNFTADSHLWNRVFQDTYSVQPSSGSLKRIIFTSSLHHFTLTSRPCSACLFHLILLTLYSPYSDGQNE